jgi:hypothetical protein
MTTHSATRGTAAPPGHRDREFSLGSDGCYERPGLRAQLHPEHDSDPIRRVVDGPEPCNQTTGSGNERRGGILKSAVASSKVLSASSTSAEPSLPIPRVTHGPGELVLCDRVYLMPGSGVAGEMGYGLAPGRLAAALSIHGLGACV